MAKLERPLDPQAVTAANDGIYVAHANDPRPNALYDANGNRLRLGATDPAQEGLRQEWRDLYRAALARKREEEPTAPPSAEELPPAEPAPPPPSDAPVSDPVQDCRPVHWFQVKLIRLPYLKAPPAWWVADQRGPYPYEPFSAEITNGSETGATDAGGAVRYDDIPAGACSIVFEHFFDALEQL